MSAPYRGGPAPARAGDAGEGGLVREMVRQFADPYAFLRELVQNGIDAGASRITVDVGRDDAGLVRTVVEDDGAGMTRSTIEGPLLTLFRSSKESDPGKIGKYGVGFVSVLATDPERVEVRTYAGPAEAWLVVLGRDHAFELARDERRPGPTGTRITLVHEMDGDAERAHVERVRAALLRWCRHAHVEVRLADERISAPLSASDGSGSGIEVRVDEGTARFALAIDGGRSFMGFYNRGLTLFEAEHGDDVFPGVVVKIDAPTLAHTLSRDNVRRDSEHRRLVRRARAIARGPLAKALHARLAEVASAPELDEAVLTALYDASRASALGGPVVSELPLPLLEPAADGRRTVDFGDALRREGRDRTSVVVADRVSPLTRALTERGVFVLRRGAHLATLGAIAPASFIGFVGAATAWVLASSEDVAPQPQDEVFLAEVRRALAATRRAVAHVRFAGFEGVRDGRAFRVARTNGTTALFRHDDAARTWHRSATLFLDEDDALVRLARRRARRTPQLAAHVLVRAILLDDGPLEPRDVDALLAAAGGRDA